MTIKVEGFANNSDGSVRVVLLNIPNSDGVTERQAVGRAVEEALGRTVGEIRWISGNYSRSVFEVEGPGKVDLNAAARIAHENTTKLKAELLIPVEVYDTWLGSYPNWIAATAVELLSPWVGLDDLAKAISLVEPTIEIEVGVSYFYSAASREEGQGEHLDETGLLIDPSQLIEVVRGE